MKTATLFCLISLVALPAWAAAPINFKNIASTNVVKTNDLLLIDSDLGGGSYATRAIPIALLPSGGDTIWTNNAGVVQYSAAQVATNVFSIVSGLTNNATNIAMIVDTAVPWSQGSGFDDSNSMEWVLRNSGTNVYRISPEGNIAIGRGSFLHNNYDINIARDSTKGDTRLIGGIQIKAGNIAGGVYGDIGMSAFTNRSVLELYALGVSTNFYTDIGSKDGGQDALNFQQYDDSGTWTTFRPYATTPYALSSAITLTSGNILTIGNLNTNKFTVAYDGSITTGGNTNRWIFASYDNSKANVTVEGNAHALLSDETPVVNGNLGSALSVGDTTFVNMLKASQTNSIASAMTFSYATNGLDLIEFTHVRTFLNGSGSDQTVNLPSGWHKGQGAGSSFVVTNATLAKLYVTCMGPTSSAALQTNVTATVSFFP